MNNIERSNEQAAVGTANGLRSQNLQSFRDCHDQYRQRLLSSMTGITRDLQMAEDITAAAFAAAFENLDRFRGESSLYTWVHTIALNLARQGLRRNRVVSLEAMNGILPAKLIERDPFVQALERSESCSKLKEALHRIPEIYRRTLVDHFVLGYPIKRIARRHEVPIGTVLSRIFSGKRRLREAWRAVTSVK